MKEIHQLDDRPVHWKTKIAGQEKEVGGGDHRTDRTSVSDGRVEPTTSMKEL
ncbi:MAG TPA: hypothetical protein VJU54_00330 [Nitrospiraceae bacterium]|nr:hypothetical protein [Nitrospiraceae bacterium]